MFQVTGSTEACDVLRLISQGSIDVFSSRHHRSLAVLQEYAPLLASFLSACRKGPGGVIPDNVLSVIDHILLTVHAPFTRPAPLAQSYPPPNPSSPLSFFPHLPQLHGYGVYEADKARPTKDDDMCQKRSYGHPTLSPGIFTIYCPHGVCYGFEVLRECESPRHPFQIFKTRFSKPPSKSSTTTDVVCICTA